MKTIIVTGSQGFLMGYLVRELLSDGYKVIGIDNYSKYGKVKRDYDNHKNFNLIRWDLSKSWPYQAIADKGLVIDYIVAGAAMIGGISYFHEYAYDLLATNERIAANTFDAAIDMYKNGRLQKIIAVSSSMVFEGADMYEAFIVPSLFARALKTWPTKEYMTEYFPSPLSTYGFQKLSMEYFAKGANEQYGLPYTIVRPFNGVGIGEDPSIMDKEVYSGNVKLRMSHVLPDLVNKVLSGQDPLHILGDGSQIRCYTHGKDIARGIKMALESDKAVNEDFNISTSRETTVIELAKLVWNEINPEKEFSFVSDKPYTYDVQKRIPDVSKAKELLGFEAQISLEESVREVVTHMKDEII